MLYSTFDTDDQIERLVTYFASLPALIVVMQCWFHFSISNAMSNLHYREH